MDRYAKGVLYVWTMPENFSDLYALPASVTGAIKDQVMRDFPIRVDGPGQVALFAYDNHTCIVESFRATETDVTVSFTGGFTRLKNLRTGDSITGEPEKRSPERRPEYGAATTVFRVHLPPHSYAAFAAEN